MRSQLGVTACLWLLAGAARADEAAVVRRDYQIDSTDPGIRLSIREVLPSATAAVAEDRVVVFVHGFGGPGRAAFDIPYRSASWAEWMARRGYAVYLFDFRNFGWSTREPAMAEPPQRNPGQTRSYLALRDLGAVVDHVRSRSAARAVDLVGWSWGGMMAGWYASLQPEKIRKLVLYAAVYSGRVKPRPFDPEGAYALVPAAAAAVKERFSKGFPLPAGEPEREDAVIEALAAELRASDPISGSRDPPAFRLPAGPAEDLLYAIQGRPLFNASSIYAPTLVIAGAADHLVGPEHREALLRDLVHAAVKREVVVPGGTHVMQFEHRREELFRAVEAFLSEPMPGQPAR